jgi:hypothetical protein
MAQAEAMALEPRSRDGIGAIQDLLACPACGGALALAGDSPTASSAPGGTFGAPRRTPASSSRAS